jgi:peroxiredoxin
MQLRKYGLLGLMLLCALPAFSQKGYEIKVHLAPLHDTVCYFGYYYGDHTYLKDTARIDHNSNVVFKGNDSIGGGIYLVVLPRKTYFELVIDKSRKFSLKTDTSDFIRNMEVSGSPENKVFYDYQKFVQKLGDSINILQAQAANKKNKDSTKMLDAQFKRINKRVADYRNSVIAQYPQSFFASVLTMMKEPDVPSDPPKKPDGRLVDTFFAYHYLKAHIFDNVDFSDSRLLRTPVFAAKVKTYLTNFTFQIPDSIIISADIVLEKAKASKEVFKYFLTDLTHQYETSNIMGMDAAFVHLVQRYYLSGQVDWVDKEQMDKLRDRVNKITPNLLGKYAPVLTMQDTLFRPVSLYDIKSKYTLVIFWKYDCGHCQHEIPILVDEYNKKLKAQGVTVFSGCTGDDTTAWKKFIRDYKMGNFINTFDPEMMSNYFNLYDVYSTPTIYLLDENKKIIAKRLDVDKIPDFINSLEKPKS